MPLAGLTGATVAVMRSGALKGDRFNEVSVVVEYPADAPRDVKAEAEGVLSSIDNYLGWARADSEAFNRTLAQRARGTIQARKARVRETCERLESTGIPMRQPDDAAKTYIADTIVRRPSPTIPKSPSTS